MKKKTKKRKNCLLCFKAANHKIKSVSIFKNVPGAADCPPLKDHLIKYFILRKVLGINEFTLLEILKSTSIGFRSSRRAKIQYQDISTWFHICQFCVKYVKKAWRIQQGIAALEGKLRDVGKEMKVEIKKQIETHKTELNPSGTEIKIYRAIFPDLIEPEYEIEVDRHESLEQMEVGPDPLLLEAEVKEEVLSDDGMANDHFLSMDTFEAAPSPMTPFDNLNGHVAVNSEPAEVPVPNLTMKRRAKAKPRKRVPPCKRLKAGVRPKPAKTSPKTKNKVEAPIKVEPMTMTTTDLLIPKEEVDIPPEINEVNMNVNVNEGEDVNARRRSRNIIPPLNSTLRPRTERPLFPEFRYVPPPPKPKRPGNYLTRAKIRAKKKEPPPVIEKTRGWILRLKRWKFNKCPHCGGTFIREKFQEHLDLHEARKLSSIDDHLNCKVCGYPAPNIEKLEWHVKRRHEIPRKVWHCPAIGCKKKRQRYVDVKQHVELWHPDLKEEHLKDDPEKLNHFKEYNLQCLKCSKKFHTSRGLLGHLRRKACEEKISICDVCGQSFHLERNMRSHKRRRHTAPEDKPPEVICDICGCDFANRTKYLEHMKRVHPAPKEGESSSEPTKIFKCRYCDVTSPYQVVIKRHKKVHLQEIPDHKCKLCEKAYLSDLALKRHIRIIHNKKEIPCPACGKVFPARDYMKTHYAVCKVKKEKEKEAEVVDNLLTDCETNNCQVDQS